VTALCEQNSVPSGFVTARKNLITYQAVIKFSRNNLQIGLVYYLDSFDTQHRKVIYDHLD
jgi:hypothetical protein